MENRRANGRGVPSKRTRNYMILGVEVLVLIGLMCALWFVVRATDKDSGIKKVEIPTEDIIINEGVQEQLQADAEEEPTFYNVALFGLDSTVGELTKNTNSDTIMIASLNRDTKEVRLMSVYRDTYLNVGNDIYYKCNSAYARGGAKQAINMLNMNLDLDITDFVAVGFKGVADAVDAVGGVYVEIDEEELKHINNYQTCIAENLQTTFEPVKEAGYQKLNGLQATAYCRIRQTGGNDFKRTERQREVLQGLFEEVKDMDVTMVTNIMENVLGNFYTSIDLEQIISLLSDIGSYKIIDEGGFPDNEYRTNAMLGSVGSCEICTNLEAAVKEFHEKFFNDTNYEVSDTVKEIADFIETNTMGYVR